MAQDSEKRFESIMNKIFHSQKSTPPSSSSSGGQLFRAKKRSALGLEETQNCIGGAEAPLCRPWDRRDLMRRLSTFKSMTWFAKPKVVSAVNCARRGWVNVDMDIIACESCGARLLFSTSSTWTQQQVEKAALVFSLKLDNGHKLLCPWINNACDERLAEFPPIMPADLVDKFKERSCSLFQLLALPVISSSAIELMRSPQLEEFLKQPLILDNQKDNAEFSQAETIEEGSDANSANLYHQAHKLISLCGWEPRSLPYLVDCKDGPKQSVNDADILNSSVEIDNRQKLSLTFNSTGENENLEANKDSESSSTVQCDLKSVALDCRLCGASVGLWAFSTVQRPTEFFRFVGYAEVDSGVHDSGHESNVDDRVVAVASNSRLSSLEQSSNLRLSIAGGPSAARQNFRATISLPVIGQSLRARLSYLPEFSNPIHDNQKETQPETEGEVGQIVPLEDMRTLNAKRDDQVISNSTVNDESLSLNHDAGARDDSFRNPALLEGTGFTAEETSHTGIHDSNKEVQIERIQDVVQGSCQSNELPKNLDNERSDHLALTNTGSLLVGESSVATQVDNVFPRNAGTKNKDSSVMVESGKCQAEQSTEQDKVCSKEISLSSHQESTCVASGLENDGTYERNSREDKTCSDARIDTSQEGTVAGEQTAENNKILSCAKGTDLKQQRMDNMTGFDPIRQHRHFCPWITTCSRAPGWLQTLSALLSNKDVSHSSPTYSPSSASVIKVTDPIASVRKLFMSPMAKRMKNTHNSS